jgi:hypothetical protein
MDGRWLGAMPVYAFLDKYVPATEEPLPDLSEKGSSLATGWKVPAMTLL